ncbi:hypothetical protein SDC9_130796 [bioreactor metagenome]|uniref:Uncharacterized protein n=1 Tax=bioreactor metagenome TaxID=1076179 RepID=A0A645D3I9_9ZZZZ
MHQRGKPADEIHAAFLRRAIHRQRKGDIVLRIARFHNQRHRGHGDALVDDGDAHLALNLLANGYEPLGTAGDLVIDFLCGAFRVAVRTVPQRNPHRDGANVEVLAVDHVLCFEYLFTVDHLILPSNAVHSVEDVFPLDANRHAEALALCVQHVRDFAKGYACFLYIHEHDHRKHAAKDGLGDVEDVDVDSGEGDADSRDDAHAVLADYGDDGMHDYTGSIHYIYFRFGEFNTMGGGKQRRD